VYPSHSVLVGCQELGTLKSYGHRGGLRQKAAKEEKDMKELVFRDKNTKAAVYARTN
jgi:hypothetical protein